MRVLLALVIGLAGVAHADAPRRVVLADADPELRRALEASLSPWQLEVIVEPAVPGVEAAEGRARARDARFVVWRAGGALVVYDRERDAAEHRDARSGALDAVAAASAALTVKTLMRLPPPPPPAAVRVESNPSAPLRVQAGVASRVARGSETAIGARFEGAVFLRPWRARGLRVGLAVELGTASEIATPGFRGEWNDASASLVAGWAFDRGNWQIEPHLGVGVARSHLEGVEASMTRSETDAVVLVTGGLWTRYRFGRFSVGAGLSAVVAPGTPTYMRASSSVEMFRVPGVGAALGLVSAFDLPL